jgi:hypothetical protein
MFRHVIVIKYLNFELEAECSRFLQSYQTLRVLPEDINLQDLST